MKVEGIAFGIVVAGLALAAHAGNVEAREDALSAGRVIIPGDSLIKISVDRKDALYRCGEETEFSIAVNDTNGDKLWFKQGGILNFFIFAFLRC